MSNATVYARVPHAAVPDQLLVLLVGVAALSNPLTSLSLGGISMAGILTATTVAVLLVILFNGRGIARGALRALWPMHALVLVIVPVSIVTDGITADGLQNLAVIIGFMASFCWACTRALRDPTFATRLSVAFVRVGGVAVGVFALQTALVGAGQVAILGPRGFSLFAAFIIVGSIHEMRQRQSRLALTLAVATAVIIAVNLSRLASALALSLLPLAWIRSRRRRTSEWIKYLAVLSVLFVLAVLALGRFQSLGERAFGGDRALEVGPVKLNASGRTQMWELVAESAGRGGPLGHGMGSAATELRREFGERIAHPHNDYLRLWHDLGWIGLALFITQLLVLMRTLGRRRAGGWAVRREMASRGLLLGRLSLMIIAFAMITDNVLAYFFVMLPAGLMLGTGVAATSPTSSNVAASYSRALKGG